MATGALGWWVLTACILVAVELGLRAVMRPAASRVTPELIITFVTENSTAGRAEARGGVDTQLAASGTVANVLTHLLSFVVAAGDRHQQQQHMLQARWRAAAGAGSTAGQSPP